LLVGFSIGVVMQLYHTVFIRKPFEPLSTPYELTWLIFWSAVWAVCWAVTPAKWWDTIICIVSVKIKDEIKSLQIGINKAMNYLLDDTFSLLYSHDKALQVLQKLNTKL